MQLVEKVKEKSRLIITLSCVLATMVALSYKLMKLRESRIEDDYHNAHLFFEKWQGGDEQSFDALSRLFKNRPSLKTLFRGRITQHLISLKKVKLAEEYRLSTYAKTPHERYAATSFLIAEGDFILALNQAQELENELETAKSAQQLLRAFNLLRIACLEKEVGTKKGELEAWRKLDALEGAALPFLQEAFRLNEVTLADYLKQRKEILSTYMPEA